MAKKSVKQLFEMLNEARDSRLALEKEAKEYKKIEDSTREALMLEIPENEEKQGITHKVVRRSSVSYTDYTAALLDYIPKTKRGEAEALKASYTTTTERHEFKL